MAKPKERSYSPVARDAAALLGEMIRSARIQRRMSAASLAERAGVSRGLVARVEGGDMGAAIGAAFEMAAILGIPLFEQDEGRLAVRLEQARKVGALLPKRAFQSRAEVDDDF